MIESFPTTREQVTSIDKDGKLIFDREKFRKNAELNRIRYIESRKCWCVDDVGKVNK